MPVQRAGSSEMKESAIAFLRLAASGHAHEAFDRYVGAGFMHHNPYFKGDATSLREAMQQNAAQHPGKLFEVQRSLQDGDLVAVHSRVRLDDESPVVAVVHVFRFADARIVELWDVGQAVPDPSPNENGAF